MGVCTSGIFGSLLHYKIRHHRTHANSICAICCSQFGTSFQKSKRIRVIFVLSFSIHHRNSSFIVHFTCNAGTLFHRSNIHSLMKTVVTQVRRLAKRWYNGIDKYNNNNNVSTIRHGKPLHRLTTFLWHIRICTAHGPEQ